MELHGFKSFADHQKLVFPGGMTAVVGPNGCGKSNISDALAWVLGEQRASLLRGSEMMDVIFAGTSDRRAMGLAEVRLTLDMPDPSQPGATRETVISRRLYRDTGGEYRINGKECRLKDIQDLLLDTGMGTRAYSFIQQGQIDLILSTKPKDRRSLIEEAAGITRYKLRRAEAERRLEDTKGNLTRLDDILHELNKQLESLKRQAAKTRRAQELDSAIKATQRILLAGKAMELEAAKERIVEQLDGLERQIASLTAQASEKALEVEHQRMKLDEMKEAFERRARGLLGLDQRLGLMDQDRGFQLERIQEAKAQQEQLQARLADLDGRAGGWDAELQALEEKLRQAGVALEARESLVSDAEEAVALAVGQVRRIEQELRDLRAQRAEAEKAALALQRQKQALHQQVAQLEGRLDALNHEEAVRAPRLEGLQADAKRLSREKEAAEHRLEQVEEAVSIQGRDKQEAETAHRAAGDALRGAEADLDRLERRLRQIQEQIRQASGSEQLQKALVWLRERGEEPLGLADVLQVDDATLADVERLLGTWTTTVLPSSHVMERLPEVPGQLMSDPGVVAESLSDLPEDCEPLARHIRWRRGTPPVLEALLRRSFRCSDEALPSLAKAHPSYAFVSPALVRLPFGPILSGVKAPEVSPLKLRSELDTAKADREEALEKLETIEAEIKGKETRAREALERFKEMEEDRLLARRAFEDLKGKHTSVVAQLKEIEEAQARADAQWELLEKEIATVQGQIRELDTQPVHAEETGLTEAIHAAEGWMQEAQGVLEERREALLESSRMRDSAWAERDAIQRQAQQLQRAAFDLEGEKRRTREDLAGSVARETAAQSRIEELEGEADVCLNERQKLAAIQMEAEPDIEEAQEHLRVLERLARELQQALENARQLHHEMLMGGAQVHGTMEAVAKEIELALGFTVPDFLGSITPEEKEAWDEGELVHQTKLNELQGRRMDLGGVNALAPQELAEAEDRLGFMNQQRTDVTDAIANLEATIKEINATSEERFREAFDFISHKFTEVFREAFGGGTAQLSLQDPKDLLECGIEITAQPPGKTAKALTLLSGGEKALTAISLLFAIFHYKPSPFCVLDEVDAPLDEANVGRFAAMVQKMKDSTQFIVISHQKPTMIAADSLYGVTMEEKGVSRLVSVHLKEAEELV